MSSAGERRAVYVGDSLTLSCALFGRSPDRSSGARVEWTKAGSTLMDANVWQDWDKLRFLLYTTQYVYYGCHELFLLLFAVGASLST